MILALKRLPVYEGNRNLQNNIKTSKEVKHYGIHMTFYYLYVTAIYNA